MMDSDHEKSRYCRARRMSNSGNRAKEEGDYSSSSMIYNGNSRNGCVRKKEKNFTKANIDKELQSQERDESKSRRSNSLFLGRLIIQLKNTYASRPTKEVSSKSVLLLLFISALVLFTVPTTTTLSPSLRNSISEVKTQESKESEKLDVSIVILTKKKNQKLLAKLLPSIISQKLVNFEVTILDTRCHSKTKKIDSEAFQIKYLPLCDNPSDFAGAKKGVEASSELSNWIMFLHDDIVLEGDDFLRNMVDIGDMKPNAGGVVCNLLSEKGKESMGAGNIVWNDGSLDGIGREENFTYTPNLSYAKPVDYGSGACLMMKSNLLDDYKGFDNENFSQYHREIDLQLHIQHDLDKEVWFQPNAIALQAKQDVIDDDVMSNSLQHFLEKWGDRLESRHLEKPFAFDDEHQWELQFMRASDLRARDASKANILWLEQAAPKPTDGSRSERAFDNLSIAAGLGHRITLVLQQNYTAAECNKECRDQITNLGVEIITGSWEEYVEKYIDFYDIVYIRNPAIFQMTYKKWQKAYKKHSFTLIYDCETLWYNRDQQLISYLQDDKNTHEFPGGVEYLHFDDGKIHELVDLELKNEKEAEMKLIQMADTVFTTSEKDRDTILELLPDTQVYTVGHAMSTEESRMAKTSFNERSGILFIGSFYDSMYYNGDAVWYFLTEVYPLVLEESESPIPFTIAGENIPKDLRNLVEKDKMLSENVIFSESPADIDELFDSARIFLAPHLYGPGIHYKVRTSLYFPALNAYTYICIYIYITI